MFISDTEPHMVNMNSTAERHQGLPPSLLLLPGNRPQNIHRIETQSWATELCVFSWKVGAQRYHKISEMLCNEQVTPVTTNVKGVWRCLISENCGRLVKALHPASGRKRFPTTIFQFFMMGEPGETRDYTRARNPAECEMWWNVHWNNRTSNSYDLASWRCLHA